VKQDLTNYKEMSKLDEDIDKAKRNFRHYLNKRQKYLDNAKKFKYYHEILINREERLFRLLSKKEKQKTRRKKND
jgi:hypothetical protein